MKHNRWAPPRAIREEDNRQIQLRICSGPITVTAQKVYLPTSIVPVQLCRPPCFQLLHLNSLGVAGEPSTACQDAFASCFAGKTDYTSCRTGRRQWCPFYPGLWDTFQLVHPEDVDRTLGAVRPSFGTPNPGPSHLIKATWTGLSDWPVRIINRSLQSRLAPQALKQAV